MGLLVALFGWSANRTLDAIAEDVRAATGRIEQLDGGLRGVLLDQTSLARRMEHAEEAVRANAEAIRDHDRQLRACQP